MRSRTSHHISSTQVHQWALSWLNEGLKLKDHGWKCTAVVVLSVVLRAAARTSSINAACRDLRHAPSDQAIFNALGGGLPKTLKVLEERLHQALTSNLPRRLLRLAWTIAIDWHLVPYSGQPKKSWNELYYGKPTRGASKFHAYATACIVVRGVRYTHCSHLGAAARSDRHSPASIVGADPQERAENQAIAAGPGVLQRAGHHVFGTGESSVPHAGGRPP